ncbi:hypothetical protein [Aeromicrobium sp. CTD01-1L150]|uniref:hypothetical protein n=1 Tax=Aeromicrobium sp. CTD01-1L150 TaxID=3341830 RepID=UPI0035BFE60C
MSGSPRRPASASQVTGSARRRPPPNVVAGFILLAIVGGVLLWQRPWVDDAAEASRLPEDASAQLDDVLRAMSQADDRESFVAAVDADQASRTFAEDAWDSREALGVTSASLRLVDGGSVADRDDGTAAARVRVSWSVDDDSVLAGTEVSDVDVLVRVAGTPDGQVSLRSSETGGEPVPLWLAGRAEVDRADDAHVVRLDGGARDLPSGELAEQAARTVRATLSTGDDVLTLVSPATAEVAAAVLGRPLDGLDRVAAVTTTVDGSRETPRLVVLNPDEFETMDRRAAQVVITHEAVHQLTGIVGTGVETWVAEGFADWVALREDDAPLALSAGQVLRRVEQDGPPERLPTQADFESAEHGIGAVYESAWMVFRMLDDDGVPEQDIVDFYRAVLDGDEVDEAARRTLGRSVEQVTRQWQDYLTKSASTVS